MMLRNTAGHDYLLPAVALVLAVLFIYAGATKFHDPLQFADTIAAFAILPAALINVLVLSLPSFEVACGFLLVVPQTRRIGALAVIAISVVFFSRYSLHWFEVSCSIVVVSAVGHPRARGCGWSSAWTGCSSAVRCSFIFDCFVVIAMRRSHHTRFLGHGENNAC
jgi:uncharacterized membrane protein YphA (DoxX/SURF4 family)